MVPSPRVSRAGSVVPVIVAAMTLGLIGASPAEAGPPKVRVCHRPPGNPNNYRTLEIGASALPSHLAHGDLQGPCSAHCPALCADGNTCTNDTGTWNPSTARCACSNPPKANNTTCDDGNPGTSYDVCVGGVCIGGFPVSCKALREAGATASDVYWLSEPQGMAYQAYCDMETDGGGWTAVFARLNGSSNVIGHFDEGSYVETCPLPATRCLRRAPPSTPSVSELELAVSCGSEMVKFSMTQEVRDWLTAGVQSGWVAVSPTPVFGNVTTPPFFLFTGQGSDLSFAFTRIPLAIPTAGTFAASTENAVFDFCDGVPDQSSLVRVFYR